MIFRSSITKRAKAKRFQEEERLLEADSATVGALLGGQSKSIQNMRHRTVRGVSSPYLLHPLHLHPPPLPPTPSYTLFSCNKKAHFRSAVAQTEGSIHATLECQPLGCLVALS